MPSNGHRCNLHVGHGGVGQRDHSNHESLYRRGISQNHRFAVSVKQREGRCILAGAPPFLRRSELGARVARPRVACDDAEIPQALEGNGKAARRNRAGADVAGQDFNFQLFSYRSALGVDTLYFSPFKPIRKTRDCSAAHANVPRIRSLPTPATHIFPSATLNQCPRLDSLKAVGLEPSMNFDEFAGEIV